MELVKHFDRSFPTVKLNDKIDYLVVIDDEIHKWDNVGT